jgi:acyl carrier protein
VNNQEDVLKLILKVLTSERRPPEGLGIDAQTPLANGGLELTSAAIVRALIDLEDVFGVELDDAAIATSRLETVGDLIVLVTGSACSRT